MSTHDPDQGRGADAEDIVEAIDRNTSADRIAALEARMAEMQTMVATVLGLEAITQVLENGFESVGDQLRQLLPPSSASDLPPATGRQIEILRESLDRPDFSKLQSLTFTTVPVPFIAVVPDDPKGGNR